MHEVGGGLGDIVASSPTAGARLWSRETTVLAAEPSDVCETAAAALVAVRGAGQTGDSVNDVRADASGSIVTSPAFSASARSMRLRAHATAPAAVFRAERLLCSRASGQGERRAQAQLTYYSALA